MKRICVMCFACLIASAATTQAAIEIVLYSFQPATGWAPLSGVIRDSDGNLYGTTSNGGAANGGVVYRLDAAGNYTVLFNFPGESNPFFAGVIRDRDGNLFGTTPNGGAANSGFFYKVDAAGDETALFNFPGGHGGRYPYAGVIRDPDGNFYGTTGYGGTAGAGVVYKLDTAGNETVLYNFPRGLGGANPTAGVIRDSAGNLFGTTDYGGTAGAGVIYKLDASQNYTVLYTFPRGHGGANPVAGLILDSEGNLYGTTYYGGAANRGVAYKLDTTGKFTVLHDFTGGSDGANPHAGVIFDSAGNLYGTTEYGGTRGLGVVYKLDPTGHETVLHAFDGVDGSYPFAGVILDSAGNLYGTTEFGGTYGEGVVFKIEP